ncbi:MAG: sigma-70 family RNA polymerase sigma factor [Streptosporangiaceae bacterium]
MPTADLVTSAKDGDTQAWDALVERFASLIWSICQKYGLDRTEVEDIGQNVWLIVVDHLGSIRDPAALAGWLVTITRRECWRALRATCKLPAGLETLEDTLAEPAATVEEELLVAERDAVLRAAFGRLPLRDQRLLSLLMADPPVSYAEISARLGIPVGSIGPSRGRCLDRLRQDPAIALLIDQAPDS